MAEIPLALLLIELEKAELRDAICDSELESSSVVPSPLCSSKLLPTALIEAIRPGICGEGVVVEDDSDCLLLATAVRGVGIEFTASWEAGVRVVCREFLRPCRKPPSRDFAEIVLLGEGRPAFFSDESWGRSATRRPLRNMVSTRVSCFLTKTASLVWGFWEVVVRKETEGKTTWRTTTSS
jgi:hypothetical protein